MNVTNSAIQKMVAAITADLSRHLQIAVDQIETEQVESVTWPDGSLGCPQPGYMYTQALVEGYRVTLKVADKRFYYHTQGTQHFVRCDQEP
ncbi:MAG: hypothetical protein R6X32_04950 [Chloroflexota bacterium]|jgi:hypothetical protein